VAELSARHGASVRGGRLGPGAARVAGGLVAKRPVNSGCRRSSDVARARGRDEAGRWTTSVLMMDSTARRAGHEPVDEVFRGARPHRHHSPPDQFAGVAVLDHFLGDASHTELLMASYAASLG
jgi:hypothetical protein